MSKIIYIALTLLVSSCAGIMRHGKVLPPCDIYNDLILETVDEELLFHVKRFEFDMRRKVSNIPLKFQSREFFEDIRKSSGKEENKIVLGTCRKKCISRNFSIQREIYINKHEWDWLTESGKEYLVYHELGHCELGRPHTEEMVIEGLFGTEIPKSIMHPIFFGDAWYYKKYRNYYIKELRDGG